MKRAFFLERVVDRKDWRAVVVLVMCAWEIMGILTRPIPTITEIWHRLRVHKVGRLGLWLMLGWLIEHLFGENR